jgi:hypothetical protein
MYKIEDWIGNEIKQKSKSGLWIDLHFNSFEDAWEYIYSLCETEDDYDDYYVEKII